MSDVSFGRSKSWGRTAMGLIVARIGQTPSTEAKTMKLPDNARRQYKAIGLPGTSESYISQKSGVAYTITALDSSGSFQLTDAAGNTLLTCRTGDGEKYEVSAASNHLASFNYSELLPGHTVEVGAQTLSIATNDSAFLSDGITGASIAQNGTTAATFHFCTDYGSGSKLIGAPPHASAARAARGDEPRRAAISKSCAWKIQDFVVALVCSIAAGMAVEAGIGLFAFGLSTYATVTELAHLTIDG